MLPTRLPSDSTGIEMTPIDGEGTSSSRPVSITSMASMVKDGAQSKWKRVGKGVVNARQFLSDEGKDKQKKELMQQRRMAHLNKFGGGMGETTAEEVGAGPVTVAPRRRRDAAPVVLWKAGMKKVSAKPHFETTWEAYGGRSFLSSHWKYDDPADEDADDDDEDLATDFFEFKDISGMRDEPEDESAYMQRDEEEETGGAAAAAVLAAAAARRPGYMVRRPGDMPRRRKELTAKPRKADKATYVFGKFLGRRLKRGVRVDKQFDDRREYFTVWLTFVQVVVMIVVLCLYPFAPVGIDVEEVRDYVLLSREGVLSEEDLQIKTIQSFWLGPSLESLILLGAKYAPCMRRDERVFAKITEERKVENSTGCCMAVNDNGCIQRENKECMTPAVEFGAGKVCGQDPDYCLISSPPSSEWDRNLITSWPQCEKKKQVPQIDALRHLRCEVTGRPCCVQTQGQCVITTESNCKFRSGIYHPEHTLCSQVDCLAATCGNNFYNNDQPDQIYRLFISLFLCAGILHLVVVIVFNVTILRDIEGYAGWFRTGLIFLLTGAGGNLWSSILLPYQAEVGESGAMFGIFACVFVEGIRKWSLLRRPWVYIGKLLLILFVALLFGLLPMVDNFAHIFGFLYGILLGFPIMPTIPTTDEEEDPEGYKRETRINLAINIVCLVFAVLLTVLGVMLFYYSQDTQSKAIALFNCPLGETFCQNFHQGQELEPRLVQY